MPMTDATPDFLHEVKMFTQKWSIDSLSLERLPWAPESPRLQGQGLRKRKCTHVFHLMECLNNIKAF